MKTIVNLLRKIPLKFRQAVLWGLVAVSFLVAVQGLVEGNLVSGFIGLAVAIVLIALHVWMFKNPQDAQL